MTALAEEVLLVSVQDRIAEIIINRPDNLNALNADVLQSLVLSFEKLEANSEVLVAIITGSGEKAFVAGADIALMQQLGPRAAADYIELGQRAMRVIERARFPVIAAVNGFALGGGLELALACDIILGSQSAKFGAPEVNLGIIPGFGATQRLNQRCGVGACKRLILTGEIIDSSEALRIGLLDKLSAEGELQSDARKMAEKITQKGPLAVKAAKRLISRSQEAQLLAGLQLEVEAFLDTFNTVDREEGMLAFMQKRQAKFVGR